MYANSLEAYAPIIIPTTPPCWMPFYPSATPLWLSDRLGRHLKPFHKSSNPIMNSFHYFAHELLWCLICNLILMWLAVLHSPFFNWLVSPRHLLSPCLVCYLYVMYLVHLGVWAILKRSVMMEGNRDGAATIAIILLLSMLLLLHVLLLLLLLLLLLVLLLVLLVGCQQMAINVHLVRRHAFLGW